VRSTHSRDEAIQGRVHCALAPGSPAPQAGLASREGARPEMTLLLLNQLFRAKS